MGEAYLPRTTLAVKTDKQTVGGVCVHVGTYAHPELSWRHCPGWPAARAREQRSAREATYPSEEETDCIV
jgi:hypothetical protein